MATTTNVGSTGEDLSYQTNTATGTAGMHKASVNNAAYKSIINDTNADAVLAKVLRSNGIYEPSDFDDWNTFYRYQRMDPYRIAPNTKEYLFFTKPDLNIFDGGDTGNLNTQIAGNSFFADMLKRGYNDVLRDLEYSVDKSCPFIRAFTNLKRSNLDLTAMTAPDQDSAANTYGTKLNYRKSSFTSDEDADFNVEFEDSKNLEVYLWFRAFDEYERKKFEGKVSPPNTTYILNKILHDQMTVFKFIVGENGEDIIHYSRITGCYPKNVNRDAFSDMPADGHIKLTTQWKGTFVKDMDPLIISHFNGLVSADGVSGNGYADPWDDDVSGLSGENVVMPYITVEQVGGYLKYRLRWRHE